jgi:hypothetical protein
MTPQTVPVDLPEQLYRRVRQMAEDKNRSVSDELTAVVEKALAADDEWRGVATEIVDEIAQLQFLDDAHLWRTARLTVPSEKSERMQDLSQKLKAEGLTAAEEEEVQQLQRYAHRIMLLRAEAAVLLKRRGFDISNLRQRP